MEEAWFVPLVTFDLSTPGPQRGAGRVRVREEPGAKTNFSGLGQVCMAVSRWESFLLISEIR